MGSGLARAVAINFVTPVRSFNDLILEFLSTQPGLFNRKFIEELGMAAWNHEDTAGNPVHMLLVPVSVVFLMLRREMRTRRMAIYVLAALGCFLLLPVIVAAAKSRWGVRYQIGFFALWAPIAGAAFSFRHKRWLTFGAAAALLVYAVPWLLYNNTRPLVGQKPWPTRVESVFSADPDELMFASAPSLRGDYTQAARVIQETHCRSVGLRINSRDLEYLFWWSLGAPENGLTVKHVFTYERLEPLLDPDFKPCAILCTICGGRSRLHGLPRTHDLDSVVIYSGPGFVWDPDG